jgi:hypothetical protein
MHDISIAVIPPEAHQGMPKPDGMLRADDYWHGEILEMRKVPNAEVTQVKSSFLCVGWHPTDISIGMGKGKLVLEKGGYWRC